MLQVYMVDKESARQWVLGELEDKELAQTTGQVLFVMDMFSKAEWKELLEAYHDTCPALAVFRTKCFGLVNLAKKSGCVIGLTEQNGAGRFVVPAHAMEYIARKIDRVTHYEKKPIL